MARLDPEVGALLEKALEWAREALYQRTVGPKEFLAKEEEHAEGEAATEEVPVELETSSEQRLADALGLLAERALAAGFENGPLSGSRASRYQVVLHVEPETLKSEGPISRFKRELLAWDAELKAKHGSAETSGGEKRQARSHLDDGTGVSSETSRRMACDCGMAKCTATKTAPS